MKGGAPTEANTHPPSVDAEPLDQEPHLPGNCQAQPFDAGLQPSWGGPTLLEEGEVPEQGWGNNRRPNKGPSPQIKKPPGPAPLPQFLPFLYPK